MKLPARKLLYSLGIPSIFIPGLILACLLGWDFQKDLARLELAGGLYQNEVIFPKTATVARAIDGDTVELETGQTVRLIGTQAPERGQPLHGESQKYLESLVAGKKVGLEYETVDNMDKYGRLVAYVYLPGSRILVNVKMLESGLAKFLFYPHYKKYKYFDALQAAETEAKNKKLGLFSKSLQ